MLYFSWAGVDLSARDYSGMIEAPSKDELEGYLFEKGIALTRWKVKLPVDIYFLRSHNITEFFGRLSTLLESGILVPHALEILEKQIKNKAFKEVVKAVIVDVQSGTPLYHALSVYSEIFDSFIVQVVRSGEESGSLCRALKHITTYRKTNESFYTKIRAAALLPAIASIVFAIVATIIFTVVIPLFASLFSSMNSNIPESTKIIFGISDFLLNIDLLSISIFLIFLLIIILFISRRKKVRVFFDRIILVVPIFSTVVKGNFRISFLNSLALLTESGVHVVSALKIVSESIKNTSIKNRIYRVIDSVAAGCRLSDELDKCTNDLFGEDIFSLVGVGEESGRLPSMLFQAAALSQEQIGRYLSFCSTLFQPIFIFALAAMIMFLISAVYIPIFNLSQVISY